MIKVCMITPKAYPVPAIRGGAVEGLVESFARENEREGKVDLTVISRMDEEAREIGKEFRNTKFCYVEYGGILDKIFASRLMSHINNLFVRNLGRMLLEEPYLKRVCHILKQDEYDLVIAEDWYAPYGIVSRQIGEEKMCWHVHGLCRGIDAINRWFAHVICVSNYVARELVMDGKVSASHVDVLQNGIQTERFAIQDPSYSRTDERTRYGIGESDMVFAYWGRLIPQKGVRELLHAFEKICRRMENAKLLIIGSPAFATETKDPYEEELRRTASVLGDKVIFTGFVRNDELWRMLHMADVAVIPTICDDAAPLANLEAGAVGLPVITTNAGGVPEYVDDSCAMVLNWTLRFEDDLADAMEHLASDSRLRAEMGARGKENAERHSVARYYEDYVRLLEQYVAGGENN